MLLNVGQVQAEMGLQLKRLNILREMNRTLEQRGFKLKRDKLFPAQHTVSSESMFDIFISSKITPDRRV